MRVMRLSMLSSCPVAIHPKASVTSSAQVITAPTIKAGTANNCVISRDVIGRSSFPSLSHSTFGESAESGRAPFSVTLWIPDNVPADLGPDLSDWLRSSVR
jgi:hypothetical protein